MRAIIVGAPLQIEGEPAEIAQLVELLTTKAVLVEHVHRWRIGDLDGSATVKGACWCGQVREFNPHVPDGAYKGTEHLGLGRGKDADRIPGENVVAVPRQKGQKGGNSGPRPLCTVCGRKHKFGRCTMGLDV